MLPNKGEKNEEVDRRRLLLLVAGLAQAQIESGHTGTYNCANQELEQLKVKVGYFNHRAPETYGSVTALFKSGTLEETYWGILASSNLNMDSTADGQYVALEIVKKKSFGGRCGRCAPVDPIEDPFDSGIYYAKLSVGNQIYDFVCQKQE